MSKKLTKYIAAFDYFDINLIVLSETNGEISIIFLTNVIEFPVKIATANFNLVLSLTTEKIK